MTLADRGIFAGLAGQTNHQMTRTLAAAAGSTVEVGNVANAPYPTTPWNNLQAKQFTVRVVDGLDQHSSRLYVVALNQAGTTGAWKIVPPLFDSGLVNTGDYAVDVSMASNSACFIRLRRIVTAGTTTRFDVIIETHTADQSFNSTVATATGVATPVSTLPVPWDPFLPTRIAGLKLWLRADSITGLVDGDPISTWSDESGHGNDATQATGANKPLYKIPDGQPLVSFDGVNDELNLPNFMSGASAGQIFIVVKVVNDPPTTGQGGLWFFGSHAFATHFPFTDGIIYDGFGSTVRKTTVDPTPSLSSAFRIYSAASAAGAWTSWLDGVQLFTTTSNTVGWTATPVLGRGVSPNYLFGDVVEVIIYDSVLSATDRQRVEAYLKSKWGLGLVPITGPTFLAADLVNSTNVFSNIAGLTAPVRAGRKYTFRATLWINDSNAEGVQFDLNGGTATSTSLRATYLGWDNALSLIKHVTALATVASIDAFAGVGKIEIAGAFEPATDGTFTPRFAQLAHAAGSLTILRGSSLVIQKS